MSRLRSVFEPVAAELIIELYGEEVGTLLAEVEELVDVDERG